MNLNTENAQAVAVVSTIAVVALARRLRMHRTLAKDIAMNIEVVIASGLFTTKSDAWFEALHAAHAWVQQGLTATERRKRPRGSVGKRKSN